MLSMHVYFRNQASRVSVKWRDKERPFPIRFVVCLCLFMENNIPFSGFSKFFNSHISDVNPVKTHTYMGSRYVKIVC